MGHLKLILLISAFVLPFVLSIIVLYESKENPSKRFIALSLITTSFIFVCNYLFFLEDYELYLPLHAINSGLQLTVFPSIYLYIRSIINRKSVRWSSLLHFLPALIVTGLASYLFYVYVGIPDLLTFLKNHRVGEELLGEKYIFLKTARYFHFSFILVHACIYSVAFYRIPNAFDEKLKNEFSNIENFSLKWIHKYNISFILFLAIGFVIYGLNPIKGITEIIDILSFTSFSAYVCIMGIVSLKQQRTEVDLDIIEDTQPINIVKTDEKRLFDRLSELMENNKLYLEPDLSLTMLCRKLGTNRSYLSSVINLETGMNFCSYVNQYRVKYAQDYRKDNPEIPNEELYPLAGFGSLSSLHRAMRNHGCS